MPRPPRIGARCRDASGCRRRCARRCCASRTSDSSAGGRAPTIVEQFLADPRVRPLPPLGTCLVAACTRTADGARGYCNTHYQRWRSGRSRPTPAWIGGSGRPTESAVAEPGQVSLRALPPLVVVEVLFGMQQRVRGGAKITDVDLRAVCDALRRQQVASIAACDDRRSVPGKPARSLLTALARHVRRALADPGQRAGQGHLGPGACSAIRGQLSFTGITQPWLAQAAKRWAAEQLPRHRGGGAATVRGKINALGRLSESLRVRDRIADCIPAVLGRRDIEGFLNRLAYLESTGTDQPLPPQRHLPRRAGASWPGSAPWA